MRVLAAMSGGVDSAVAAARAVAAGHDVVGVHMALSKSRDQLRNGSRGCCTIEDASDARRACDILGIPYYVWDLSDAFEDTVISDFLSEYQAGRTPNPCVRCNEHIKFATLLDRAVALGFDAVCTGHYARIEHDANGKAELHRSNDPLKDQSYVLAVMGRERLEKAIFPLGPNYSKDETRAEADARGLQVSNKPDSYDICFVADGDTKGFLQRRLGAAPGEIVDNEGNIVGEHEGAYAYTVGQRKGLHLGNPAPDGKPRYVLEVQPETNRVIVGAAELLTVNQIATKDVVWFDEPPAASEWFDCEVQVRAHGTPVPARVSSIYDASGNATGVMAHLKHPLRGVAPGQSLVAYVGTRVAVQATITAAKRLTAAELAASGSGVEISTTLTPGG